LDLIVILGVSVLIIVVAAYLILHKLIRKKNEFTYYSEEVEKQAANIDIELEKQYDAINSLANVLQQHGDRELTFSKEVTLARGKNQTVFDRSSGIDMAMQQVYKMYNLTPRISSDPMYKRLMDDIKIEAENVAAAKRKYTATASSYNKRISMSPYSYFAKQWGFEKKELFQTSSGAVDKHNSKNEEERYNSKKIFE